MTKIGLLSDTHGNISDRIVEFFANCNQIWHAGDIGEIKSLNQIFENKIIKAVYGNIDNNLTRIEYKESLRFFCEDVDVFITHIGGYPDNYKSIVKKIMLQNPPDLFICGHSHILKIIYDKKFNCLHLNPGAAGNYGFHKVITAIKFTIEKKDIKDMEILEIQR